MENPFLETCSDSGICGVSTSPTSVINPSVSGSPFTGIDMFLKSLSLIEFLLLVIAIILITRKKD